MDRLLIIDSSIRLLAIGQLLLTALVIGRGRSPRPIRIATAALLLSVCAYLALATPTMVATHGPFWALVQLSAQSTPMLLWIFAHLLFERPINRAAAAGGAAVVFGCWTAFALIGPHPDVQNGIGQLQRSVSLVMTIHAMLIAVRERGDDLIEKRRRLRVGFVIIVGSLSVIVLLLEMVFGYRGGGLWLALPQAIAILIATTSLGAALLQSDPDLLFDPASDAPPTPTFTPSEQVLKQKLDAIMAGGIHRETGLTIGQLAQRLSVPEHRLRALINQRLGYRNFSAFLNHHRIAEAKAMLADPAHVDLPILTIAMDLGYGSLAPFNRAFRADAGQAPSDFRRAAFTEKS